MCFQGSRKERVVLPPPEASACLDCVVQPTCALVSSDSNMLVNEYLFIAFANVCDISRFFPVLRHFFFFHVRSILLCFNGYVIYKSAVNWLFFNDPLHNKKSFSFFVYPPRRVRTVRGKCVKYLSGLFSLPMTKS